jgi:hypothetical protein
MIMILDRGGCPVMVHASAWDRFLARAHADHLDTRLAGGASPDDTLGLALRAQMLERAATRRHLALAAQRVMSVAARGNAARVSVPICRDRVLASYAEFSELVERLQATGPVSARGMALVRALFIDAGSPLYNRGNSCDLRASVRAAADALSVA